MEYYTLLRDDSVNLWQGITLWSINMKNISRFEIETGVFIDSSLEKTNYPSFNGGSWACNGGVCTIYGIWGVSMSHKFEMGYGVSQGNPAYVYLTPSNVGLAVQANHYVHRTGVLTDFHIF